MFSFSEHLTQAGKAVVDAQLDSAQALIEAAFDNSARVATLNLDAARASLAAAAVAGQQLLSVKDPQTLLQLSRTQSQLAIDRIGSYGRQVKDVAQENQENLLSVTNSEIAASRQKFGELLQAVKETPLPLIIPFNNFLKSPFGAAYEGYDKSTRSGH